MRKTFRLAALPCLALLAACAAPEGEYPSLAIRDIERVTGTMMPTQTPPAPPPARPADPTLAQLDSLAGSARAAHQRFLAKVDEAARVIGAAGGSGSESWARAQVALADLQAERSAAMIALADIDRLYVDAAREGTDTAYLRQVHTEVTALVAAEDQRLADMSVRLSR